MLVSARVVVPAKGDHAVRKINQPVITGISFSVTQPNVFRWRLKSETELSRFDSRAETQRVVAASYRAEADALIFLNVGKELVGLFDLLKSPTGIQSSRKIHTRRVRRASGLVVC